MEKTVSFSSVYFSSALNFAPQIKNKISSKFILFDHVRNSNDHSVLQSIDITRNLMLIKGLTEMIFSAFISSSCSSLNEINCVFSHDDMAAIFVSQNNETAAMFVSQTSPVGVELFSYVNAFFCSNKFS